MKRFGGSGCVAQYKETEMSSVWKWRFKLFIAYGTANLHMSDAARHGRLAEFATPGMYGYGVGSISLANGYVTFLSSRRCIKTDI